MYEKFYNNYSNSDCIDNYDSYAFESRTTFDQSEIDKWMKINGYSMKRISLEADDDPFADIGNDDTAGGDDFGGGDDPFAADAGGGTDNDDPFGGIGEDTGGGDPFGGGDDGGGFDFGGASDDGGDIFGDSGNSEEEQQKAKERAMILDRAKSIKEDFDISRQIRTNFPKKFLELKQIALNNINILERTVLDKQEYDEVLRGIIVEYERMYDLLEAYISVMAKKTYEDIFATYVSIHTSFIRLKNLYLRISGVDKKDYELEESKYSEVI